jgi:Tol biopolymer transport system component
MNRRIIVLVLAAFLVFAVPGWAAEPAGPRLGVVTFDHEHGSRLITIGPAGESPRALVLDPDSRRPSWSADGNALALASRGVDENWPVVAIAEAGSEKLRFYRRAVLDGGSDPVIAPDGQSVVFARARFVRELPGRENYLYKGSLWSLDLASGEIRQRTRWRLGFPVVPSSLSPDGSTLAAAAYGPLGWEAVAIDLRSGATSRLAREAQSPVFSPDGSQVVFTRWRNWRRGAADDGKPPIYELRVATVEDYPRSRLVLRRKGILVWPSWDPSGNRLTFTQSHVYENGYESPEAGDKLMSINVDGTCLTEVLTSPDLTIEGAAWRPGLGREAGPISC